ncbi:trk system potassium uptake protein TrkA [Persephonella hydrogeniphila]|uniref:Trk system potassium uptake protein TrkA n=1 Tax=Persephonella hydrogeniphila TaxID=198703 RepID=A0A285NJ05_9AQUI|nr:NAD-binding protein [Persephonella hydrogeniphila]SNZ07846.1 trk system potassium uptake protein TrkA [Persephonella hydrogeniphila]
MKICIVGAGVVGSYLARKLSGEGYDIAIIDKDSKKIEDLQMHADIAAYNCDAFDENCIGQLKDYDLYIVATNKDEINLSVALMLKAVFNKDKIFVRVDKDILSKQEIEKFLKVEIVNTFKEIYKNVETIIDYPFISYFNELEDGKFIIFSYRAKRPDIFTNSQISALKELRDRVPFTLVLIERDGKSFIPRGDKTILEDDILYILLEKERLKEFAELSKIQYSPVKNVVFLGMSKVGFSILRKINEEKNLKIKVVEEDIKICEEIASEFPEVMVLNGKITDQELLESEGIGNTELVISASYKEDNILACIIAKKLGAKKVLAVIEKPEYEEIAHSLGIDIPIVARKLIARKVYRRIRHRGLKDIFELKENLKVYEKTVDKELSGRSISEISLKNSIVLSVVRDGKMNIVHGNFVLRTGDILVILEKEEENE